jgi:pimeloyl-ACP methyl ester carboxylesterase
LQTDGIAPTAKRIAATWFMKGEDDEAFPLCFEMGKQASMQAALASLSAWETWDGRTKLRDIKCKTLVVWGDHDRSYGWSQPEALWQGIKHSSLAVVPDCAHNVHLEKPDLFNTIVDDFLPTNP